ncbi:MAG: hypothetical protein JNM68_17290 [Dinghuibacter sp.]|nr:hypothetical protein [Dinghuibacter sp.]
MDHAQQQKIKHFRLVIEYCRAQRLVLRHFPEFEFELLCFTTLTDAADALAVQELQVITGHGAAPERARKTLCALAAHISQLVEIYADDAQYGLLKESLGYTQASLRRCSDKRLLKVCRDIHGIAEKYAGVLERYGLARQTTEVLLGAVEMYNAVVPPPKDTALLYRHYQKRFAFFVYEASQKLKNRLDVLAKKLMYVDREFYNGYMEIRQLARKAVETAA